MQVTSANDLSDDGKLRLNQLMAGSLTGALGCPPVSAGEVRETCNRAMVYLSVREAWIYRDWQAAIGDGLLRQVQLGQPLFEVIGYKDFEATRKDGNEADQLGRGPLDTRHDQ